MQLNLIYCYDAYCGWCYGFSPVIRKISEEFKEDFRFEVLSGGMIITETPIPISSTAAYIQKAYKTVEEYTGIEFGQDYLWHIFNPDQSDWFPSSEKPSIALCIFKEIKPELQVSFASDLQHALHYEGRDLCDDEAYRHLLEKYELDPDDFYTKLHSESYKEKAYYEFSLCKQLQVTGYPTVFVQANESKYYLVAKGYTDHATLSERLKNVIAELSKLN
ncbi:MAG: DsbA family protein [Chitinophagaceae bacterium]|uniref:DsbA family protein n=1 Tax=unclassified Paraflavitalea TaxID=2798305 RepID=UPI003D354413|nr:DsbA family protein [Chitinophagaceae bacterium]